MKRFSPPSSIPWPLSARLGAVLWPSFFAAGVATMMFFAMVDPLELAAATWPRWELSREAGYTLGFFLFWACTASACAFTALLLMPAMAADDTKA